jgi:hypothetical protein
VILQARLLRLELRALSSEKLDAIHLSIVAIFLSSPPTQLAGMIDAKHLAFKEHLSIAKRSIAEQVMTQLHEKPYKEGNIIRN